MSYDSAERTLIEASHVVNELDSIASGVGGGLEVAGYAPDVASAVRNALDNDLQGNGIVGLALEELEGDSVGAGGGPLDGEIRAGRDNLCMLVHWFSWSRVTRQ